MPRSTRSNEWSRGSWGWNPPGTRWIPPQYAGHDVELNVFESFIPNANATLDAWDSPARHVHLCASRRGGKTFFAGRKASRRSISRSLRVQLDQDNAYSSDAFNTWFESFVGPPGKPKVIRASDARASKFPVPCTAVSPTHELTDLQKAELKEIWEPFTDELGVIWLDGNKVLCILALGIRWTFFSADRPTEKVGTGNVIVWVGEAARCKFQLWENINPTLFDREGSLITDTTPWGGKDIKGYFGECWAHGDRQSAEDLGRPEIYDPDTRCFHWTADENYHRPELAVQMAKDRRSYGPNSAYFRRTWLASWDLPEGMCWPEFSMPSHVCHQDPNDYDIWIAGQDHGYAQHPGCLLVAGLSKKKPRKVHIFYAYYGTGYLVTPSDGTKPSPHTKCGAGFALDALQRIQEHHPRARIMGYAGPERPEAITAMRRKGLRWNPASHVSVDGIEQVERLLVEDERTGKVRLTFSPALPLPVFHDIQGAFWAEDSRGRSLPRFDKDRHDPHAGEALVYLVSSVANLLDIVEKPKLWAY